MRSLRRLIAAAALAVTMASCDRAPATLPVEHFTPEALHARIAESAKAKKVVVLHLWATWCGPCIEEFPTVVEMHKQVASDPSVDFIVLSVDEPPLSVVEKEGLPAAAKMRDELVMKFVMQNGGRFRVSIADTEDPEAFARSISPSWPGVLPTTFVYDTKGEIRFQQLGEIRSLSAFRDKIEKARQPAE